MNGIELVVVEIWLLARVIVLCLPSAINSGPAFS